MGWFQKYGPLLVMDYIDSTQYLGLPIWDPKLGNYPPASIPFSDGLGPLQWNFVHMHVYIYIYICVYIHSPMYTCVHVTWDNQEFMPHIVIGQLVIKPFLEAYRATKGVV